MIWDQEISHLIMIASPFIIVWLCKSEEKARKHAKKKHDEYSDQLVKDALKLYVRTGRKIPAFHLAHRYNIKAAESARLDVIQEERAKICKENIEFKAVQQCPKCRTYDTHWITLGGNGRECIECGYGWHTALTITTKSNTVA